MKNIFLIYYCVFSTIQLVGQNTSWNLPPNNIEFSTSGITAISLPTVDPITLQPYADVLGSSYDGGGYRPELIEHLGASNAISGTDGQLLFFIVGKNIFDGKGRTIATIIAHEVKI